MKNKIVFIDSKLKLTSFKENSDLKLTTPNVIHIQIDCEVIKEMEKPNHC